MSSALASQTSGHGSSTIIQNLNYRPWHCLLRMLRGTSKYEATRKEASWKYLLKAHSTDRGGAYPHFIQHCYGGQGCSLVGLCWENTPRAEHLANYKRRLLEEISWRAESVPTDWGSYPRARWVDDDDYWLLHGGWGTVRPDRPGGRLLSPEAWLTPIFEINPCGSTYNHIQWVERKRPPVKYRTWTWSEEEDPSIKKEALHFCPKITAFTILLFQGPLHQDHRQ